MAIPDETYFGPEGITFGEVRNTSEQTDRIKLLKKRLDSFFFEQVAVLNNKSPFPMTIMTCIGIETMGQIFIANENGTQSFQFIQIISKVHQKFGRKIGKNFEQKFRAMWPYKDSDVIETYGDLLYSYLRNTMIHGYYALGIYLSDDKAVTLEEKDGYLVLNPYWFWEKFTPVYDSLIMEAIEGQENNSYRINSIKYLEKMLR